jgi:hypothetical protein
MMILRTRVLFRLLIDMPHPLTPQRPCASVRADRTVSVAVIPIGAIVDGHPSQDRGHTLVMTTLPGQFIPLGEAIFSVCPSAAIGPELLHPYPVGGHTMSSDNEALLRALVNICARVSISPQKLANIVMSRGATEKQWRAYNLCDGTRTQGEIAKTLKLDPGNFSRTVGRWIEEGVVFRLSEGRDSRLLHAYFLTKDAINHAGEL